MSFPNVIFAGAGEQFNTYVAGRNRGLASIGRLEKGQKMELADGRVFRFSLAGATDLVAGNLQQSIAADTAFDTLAVQAAVAIGDTTIPFTEATTFTAEGDLEGGYLVVESAAALGHCYKIAKNAGASSGATTETVTLEGGETVQVPLTTSHKVTPLWSIWHNLIIATATTPTGALAGVAPVIIKTTEFGWVQTHGVASCLIVGTEVTGEPLILGATAGAVGPREFEEATDAARARENVPTVAIALEIAPTTDFGMVFLVLE